MDTTAPDGVDDLVLTPGAIPAPGYRLIARLGSGGFGEVWKAEAQGGFHHALKFVRLDHLAASSTEMRTLEILKAIHHPHLLTTFAAWQSRGYLIIAMELADRSLADRLREALDQGHMGIPRDELYGYLQQAAEGLDHLNSYRHRLGGKDGVGLQHRDIKPQNILLMGDAVKLADFGLMRLLEKSAASHTGGLTVGYAAPEFFDGQTFSTSDQYSLAATFVQLRTGHLPFTGSVEQIINGHLARKPDLTGLSIEEQPLVERALAKKPQDRWPSCQKFAQALAGTLENSGETIANVEPGMPTGGLLDSTSVLSTMPPAAVSFSELETQQPANDGTKLKAPILAAVAVPSAPTWNLARWTLDGLFLTIWLGLAFWAFSRLFTVD